MNDYDDNVASNLLDDEELDDEAVSQQDSLEAIKEGINIVVWILIALAVMGTVALYHFW